MEDSVDMDMSLLRPQNYLFTVEEDAESEDEEEEDVKLLSISGKWSAPGGSKVPQKKVKLAADEDDDDEDDDNDDFYEEAEEKNQSKGQESFKKQEKNPKTPKGPSSVEDIKAKMQASIEKGGSLPRVEAKFINYVKNCFRTTEQEAIQDLWQWRKSL
ncbi:nucleophosmin-like isoform X2 [Piliocolobus tephrosceles]|uniref:nucleophosmin-like isoform X2 n=1 Tax=Piliocolobus tephrosceles TaxID=591936 RepID=UPI000C2A333D|nr:nucleophosmin-like isoform X2 [Piliocolobus tephrosceles]